MRWEPDMPRAKNTCPFTDNPCNDCRALFTEENDSKTGEKKRGCHLTEKNEKPDDK